MERRTIGHMMAMVLGGCLAAAAAGAGEAVLVVHYHYAADGKSIVATVPPDEHLHPRGLLLFVSDDQVASWKAPKPSWVRFLDAKDPVNLPQEGHTFGKYEIPLLKSRLVDQALAQHGPEDASSKLQLAFIDSQHKIIPCNVANANKGGPQVVVDGNGPIMVKRKPRPDR